MSADLVPLVRAAQRGDTLAMNELLDRLAPYVGRICGPIALWPRPNTRGTVVALTGGVRILGRPALVPLGVRREARRSLDRLGALLDAGPAPGQV